jgi:hypothetical protein
MATGRPRAFVHPRYLSVVVEHDWHRRLSGAMLAQYRERHPQARLTDLLRDLIGKGIREHERTAPERDRAVRERRQQLRKLAVACVSASDDKLEAQARKLAALVGP